MFFCLEYARFFLNRVDSGSGIVSRTGTVETISGLETKSWVGVLGGLSWDDIGIDVEWDDVGDDEGVNVD